MDEGIMGKEKGKDVLNWKKKKGAGQLTQRPGLRERDHTMRSSQ